MHGGDDIDTVDVSGAESDTESSEIAGDVRMQTDAAMPEAGDMGRGRMGEQGDFTITGYSSDEAMLSFLNGGSRVVDGEMFPENDTGYQCIISSELATYNELETGDTITLTNPNNEEESYTFTISGIYESTETSDSAGNMMRNFSAAYDTANQIYTSYENLKDIADTSETSAVVSTDETTGMECMRTEKSLL